MKKYKLETLKKVFKEGIILLTVSFWLSFLFGLILNLVREVRFSFLSLFELPLAVTMFLVFPIILNIIIIKKHKKIILFFYPVIVILEYFVILLITYYFDTLSLIKENMLPSVGYLLRYETRLFITFIMALITSLILSLYKYIKNEK